MKAHAFSRGDGKMFPSMDSAIGNQEDGP